jgi:hypothetical protein
MTYPDHLVELAPSLGGLLSRLTPER